MNEPQITDLHILYDPQCPACQAYCAHIQKALPNTVTLHSARTESEILQSVTTAGLDIDSGFVVRHGNRLLSGAEAIHTLDRALGNQHWIHRVLFGQLWLARLLYPLLAGGRRILLFINRVPPIRNLK